jgi:hypothetical protein
MTRSELSRQLWMALSTIAIAFVVYLVIRPSSHVPQSPLDLSTSQEVAKVVGPSLVAVTPGSALERKIQVRSVESRKVNFPLLAVTASVAAHTVKGKSHDRWQFQGAEISAAYADFQRAQNDAEFAEKQLAKTQELARTLVSRYTNVYERLKKLVETGTESGKDLITAQADLAQSEIQTQKDTYDAQSALNTALRNRAAAQRTLVQGGLDPAALETEKDVAIVVAHVPEAKIGFVREGQACEARFYALPDSPFPGRVTRILSTLSPERRTLRVLFELEDPENRLRPGMFADVGLGTDPRETLLAPSEAVLHVGRGDYVFARSQPGPWSILQVELGEPHDGLIEIRRGLTVGQEVIGPGAILLKPLLVSALEK